MSEISKETKDALNRYEELIEAIIPILDEIGHLRKLVDADTFEKCIGKLERLNQIKKESLEIFLNEAFDNPRDMWNDLYGNKLGTDKYTISKPDENIEKIAKSNTGKVLDVGIGDGSNFLKFKELGFDVYGIDVSDEAIKRMKGEVPEDHLKEVNLMTGDDMPFSDNFFDVVFARLVLHYLNDEQVEFVLDEFDRILKPNGLLFISVKVANVGNIDTGKKMRTKEEWEELLSGCFEVKESNVLVKKPYDYDPAPSNMLEIFARPID